MHHTTPSRSPHNALHSPSLLHQVSGWAGAWNIVFIMILPCTHLWSPTLCSCGFSLSGQDTPGCLTGYSGDDVFIATLTLFTGFITHYSTRHSSPATPPDLNPTHSHDSNSNYHSSNYHSSAAITLLQPNHTYCPRNQL